MENGNAARALVLLSNLAVALQDRYDRTGSLSDLEWAIKMNTVALALRPPGHGDRWVSLCNLSIAHFRRFERLGNRSDFERAANLLTDAFALPPFEPEVEVQWISSLKEVSAIGVQLGKSAEALSLLNKLALALMHRHNKMGSQRDLAWAIELNTAALRFRPPGHSDRYSSLTYLAFALSTRYHEGGVVSDLQRAIDLNTEALTLRPPGHGDRGMSLNYLAADLNTRYNRLGNLADLERAVELHKEALVLRPPGHGDRGSSLNNLAAALNTRFDRTGDLTDFEHAVELYTEALALCPPGHEDRGLPLVNLASALSARYGIKGNLADLERAVKLYTEAVELYPPGHRHRGPSLSNLACALSTRYNRLSEVADLKRAVELHTEALSLYPPGHGDRGTFLNNLAGALNTRFKRMYDPMDLERAIELHKEALVLHPTGHWGRIASLNNLATALSTRYDREGNLADLERAVELYTEGAELTPPGHGSRGSSLSNLANALSTRYNSLGKVVDLERTVELHTEALALHPPGNRDRGSSLNNLANALSTRYNRMGNLTDLERAIELHTEALALHPPGHGYHGLSLNSLASALHTRFRWTDDLTDLERAIELHEEALKLNPLVHDGRALCLDRLATVLLARHNKASNGADLEQAIGLFTEALKLVAPAHKKRGDLLYNLGIAYATRWGETKHPTDLKQSIELYTDALTLFPPGDTRRVSTIAGLSMALWHEEICQKEKVFELLKEGSTDLTASLDTTLECARLWISYGREVDDHKTVLNAYDAVIGLLQHHLPLLPTTKLQYEVLCKKWIIVQLPMDAAAHAIEIGDVEKAVEFLDSGRSFLWSALRRFREPLLQSELLDTKLAEDFESVRLELQNISAVEARFDDSQVPSDLEGPGKESIISGTSYDILIRRKRVLLGRYDSLLHRIRETPGLEGFLRRSSFEELQVAAEEGPIIIINCSSYDAQVIIVLAGRPPSLINLDGSFRETALRLYAKLLSGTHLHSTLEPLGRDLKEIAKFLWDEVAEVVVEKLGKEGVPKGSRIWWCPTSILTSFPFHAAGHKKVSLNDFYISSYTPTLKALIDARKSLSLRANFTHNPFPRILVVAQSQESSNLPSIRKELDIMRKVAPDMVCLDQEEATVKTVLEHLKSHNWVHFTCHGRLLRSPFDSSLVLYNGEKLRLNDIIHAQLPDAEFAFLAACHTAEQSPLALARDAVLFDEALHLASAMFFSGFRSVVGTMWKMRDEDGPEVARLFYEEMLKEDDIVLQKPRHTRAAYALWKVTERLKDRKLSFDRWANFVHIGA